MDIYQIKTLSDQYRIITCSVGTVAWLVCPNDGVSVGELDFFVNGLNEAWDMGFIALEDDITTQLYSFSENVVKVHKPVRHSGPPIVPNMDGPSLTAPTWTGPHYFDKTAEDHARQLIKQGVLVPNYEDAAPSVKDFYDK